jgi:3-methyladenine DNA glycosylase AlkD
MATPDPRQLANAVKRDLAKLGDGETAARGRTFFKRDETVPLHGVRAADIRRLATKAYQRIRADWGIADAVAFCDFLARDRYLEAKMVGCLLLGRYRRQFPEELWFTVRGWVETDCFNSWAAVDGMCPAILTPLVVAFPELRDDLPGWTTSASLWCRRAALVTLVPLARRGQHLDLAYDLAFRVREDTEDLIHKAAGWLLREAGRTDMKHLEAYLIRNGQGLPRTTVRYAIERYPEQKRNRLLMGTRAAR